MHLFTVLAIPLAACGHEELDFKLPDGGRTDRQDGEGSKTSVDCTGSASSSSCWNSFEPTVPGRLDAQAGTDGASNPASGAGGSAPDQASGQLERYQDDPRGYPTG